MLTSWQLGIFLAILLLTPAMFAAAEPELPRRYIDTSYTPSATGASIYVPVGADLQTAINMAQLGDTIVLEPGASYVGHFVLPPKTGTGWITIQSLGYSQLPGADERVKQQHFASLPKLITPNSDPAIDIRAGAHHYRLVGLEITSSAPMTWQIVSIMDGSDIIIDRCYIHGRPDQNVIRGVLADGPSVAVINSHIEDIHWAGMDSQGIGAAKSPGPFKIVNNFIAAAGENVMFGGSRSPVAGTVPSDIESAITIFSSR